MGKKKIPWYDINNDERYQAAETLHTQIKQTSAEIRVLDEALCQIQMEKIEAENRDMNKRTNPLFSKFLRVRKQLSADPFFGEFTDYRYGTCITLTEAEMLMLKGFKEARLKKLNELVLQLSKEINED